MKRKPHKYATYSMGKWSLAQRYVIGWEVPGVIKVGCTMNGRSRYGGFISRGGVLLDLQAYSGLGELEAEAELKRQLEARWPRAFNCKEEAAAILGNRGAGYTECFLVPPSDWADALEITKGGEEDSMVQSGRQVSLSP